MNREGYRYCLYCMKKEDRVKWLKPVYDWTDQKLVGYYCEVHYQQIIKFQNQQEAAYNEYKRNRPKQT